MLERLDGQAVSNWCAAALTRLRQARPEIDSLNGYISRRGAELGVATPVNHALYTLVKLAETAAGTR